ncbi:MAG: DUF4258 domain-containing protein, partial [Lachnospiraceae bacterium]|nr:DUF4258 domain-containing protein [Lachnospiraceae bacterium]
MCNEELNIAVLRTLCSDGKIRWPRHALKRLRERSITTDDFEKCIMSGKIIRQYPDE